MTKKAVVAGHVCIDITPAFYNEPVDQYSKIFVPGTLLNVGEASINPGGVVSNTGLAMQFFGIDTHLMGRIGTDSFGSLLEDTFRKYNAKVSWKHDDEVPTGYTIVLSPNGLNRMFLHNEGTCAVTKNTDFDFDEIRKADLFHFGYPTIMKSYWQNNAKELLDLYQQVHSLGTVTSLDLQMIDRESDGAKMDWNEIFKKLLPNVDIFVPSFDEIQLLIDPKRYDELHSNAKGSEIVNLVSDEEIYELANRLISYGSKIVLIKCGERGMFLVTSNEENMNDVCEKLSLDIGRWSNGKVHQPSFAADRVRASTGAGDTSIAAFLTSILNGYEPQKSLQFASATGACCVTEFDALSGLLSFEEMSKKIESGWKVRDINKC